MKVNELQRNIADINKLQNLGFNFPESLENFVENKIWYKIHIFNYICLLNNFLFYLRGDL